MSLGEIKNSDCTLELSGFYRQHFGRLSANIGRKHTIEFSKRTKDSPFPHDGNKFITIPDESPCDFAEFIDSNAGLFRTQEIQTQFGIIPNIDRNLLLNFFEEVYNDEEKIFKSINIQLIDY